MESSIAYQATDWQGIADSFATSLMLTADDHAPNFSSPVSSLPPELLAKIFEIGRSRKRLRNIMPFEAIVSHVSSYWRRVATTTPFLWTDIDIYSNKSLDWVGLYLERSKGCPLDIRLDLYRADRAANMVSKRELVVTDIAKAIAHHIDRCQRLLVFTYLEKTAYAILSQFSDLSASILQRLTVSVDVGIEDAHFPLSIFLGGAPCLEFFRSKVLHCCGPPLTGLTTLHLLGSNTAISLDHNQLREAITASPSLATLSINTDAINCRSWPVPDPTFDMVSLRSLQIIGNCPCISNLLLSISAPLLLSLWIENPCGAGMLPFLESQGSTRFPALRYLTLQRANLSRCSLFTRVLPSISHIHLSYCHSYSMESFVNALTVGNASQWPNLHTIVIRTIHDSRADTAAISLTKLAQSRMQNGRPLHKLLLDGDLMRYFMKVKVLGDTVDIEQLGSANYAEPWWVMTNKEVEDGM